LKTIAQGGKALAESSSITPGAREDFGNGGTQDLAHLKSVKFLAERDVSSRQIERHKGKVSRVLHYRIATERPDRGLLVHLTADGRLTDYDIVDD
jgi:hypothetical protein